MKERIQYIVVMILMLLSVNVDAQALTDGRKGQEAAAREVIDRFTGGQMPVKVVIDLQPGANGCDQYRYSADRKRLIIHASSAVAACRAFYDYAKEKRAGIRTWSDRRFERPDDISCKDRACTTLFRDHQYFNVVTYGYTMPFWNEARWDEEIDWMALHGIDMPLMLVGAEGIYREVFREMGLTDSEIDDWEVGPAHLPWFRMGNLSGNSFDGPLGKEWHESQRRLAHHILDRMRALGMKPVCPAFGGFVPKAFSGHYDCKTEQTGWNWVPGECRNYRLSPASRAFVEAGTRFIRKWEEEYGVCRYYLSDSFNEMTIPDSLGLLTEYGDNVFRCISEGSGCKDAVWVTQGWTLVYQSGEWGKEKFGALTRNIPDDRFLLLYMSPEYGPDRCWERYDGFGGKEWNYTMLPNMGGKTFWTGNLNNYAVDYLRKLRESASRGNVTGFGLTPEGLENNEMLYELITDAGWTDAGAPIDIEEWMANYAKCRYGLYPDELKEFHVTLRNTLYSRYTDHPRFGWQVGNNLVGEGNARVDSLFTEAVLRLLTRVGEQDRTFTGHLEYELAEMAAMCIGHKVELLARKIKETEDSQDAALLIGRLDRMMLQLDSVLCINPMLSLERWERMAVKAGGTPADGTRNAVNARRLITVWYGNHRKDEPVQDYAARLWSGLVRDYYRPRLVSELKYRKGLLPTWDRIGFENRFVSSAPTLSPTPQLPENHIAFLKDMLCEIFRSAD